MIKEYVYKTAVDRAEVIDKTFQAILKSRRPKTFAVLNALRWPWLWKLAGIHLTLRYKGDLYEEYGVFQHDDLLGTFGIKQNFHIS